MPAIEISFNGQKYVIKGDESEEHLNEIAQMVQRKLENIMKNSTTISMEKASILAALDLASNYIKGRKKALEYKSMILNKAQEISKQINEELAS